uniref:Uncharacterized protein n=1 Tax=viral metagenome TaxID=1070528 RepID=A0A6C0AF70_9ZZZZ
MHITFSSWILLLTTESYFILDKSGEAEGSL